MRKAHLVALVAGFAVTFVAGMAKADPYKWCADYTVRGGATNCGFVTLEQCRATVSGIGGFCRVNGFYTGPEERPVRHVRNRD
jgi:Protein of unknown function (DUF3551)